MDAALPSELLVAPQPLIGFCGLDAERNAVHKIVWDAFSSNRKAERWENANLLFMKNTLNYLILQSCCAV